MEFVAHVQNRHSGHHELSAEFAAGVSESVVIELVVPGPEDRERRDRDEYDSLRRKQGPNQPQTFHRIVEVLENIQHQDEVKRPDRRKWCVEWNMVDASEGRSLTPTRC